MKMDFTELAKAVNSANRNKGFYDEIDQITDVVTKNSPQLLEAFKSVTNAQRIALIQSEASEMLEAERKAQRFGGSLYDTGKLKAELLQMPNDADFSDNFKAIVKDSVEDELADVIIRCLDFAGENNIDIDFHIKAKLRYNSTRPYKHAKNF